MSAAARELGVSQPAISRQLQILEADLGAALFHRNRRGLTLTSAGNAYRHAVALGLDHIAQATAAPLYCVPGDCSFCGNECDLKPGDHWWCLFCGTLYEGT